MREPLAVLSFISISATPRMAFHAAGRNVLDQHALDCRVVTDISWPSLLGVEPMYATESNDGTIHLPQV
jgi:hypothetical protein